MPTQKWTCEQCGTSFNSFQDASDCERSHKSGAKGYRASTSGRLAKTGVPEDRSVYLIHEPGQEVAWWGCHINISDSYDTKRYPEWVKSLRFSSSWGNRGLVVWDESIKTVAYIRSVDAFELLTDLQTNDIGAVTVVGERRMKLSGNQFGQEPPYTLVNQISLDAAQAHELLSFLQANEPLLQKMAKEAEERWDQALRTAYQIMIQAYLRIEAEKSAEIQS